MKTLQKGTFLFEDMPDGTVAFRADYHGGFDERSHVHKLMNQIIKWLDEQAASRELVPRPDQTGPSEHEPSRHNGDGHA